MANASLKNNEDNLTSVLYGVRDLRLVSNYKIYYLRRFLYVWLVLIFFSVRNKGRYQNLDIMVMI